METRKVMASWLAIGQLIQVGNETLKIGPALSLQNLRGETIAISALDRDGAPVDFEVNWIVPGTTGLEYKCPKCGGIHFGSHQKPGEPRVYHCHGTKRPTRGGFSVEVIKACGWNGRREECFTEAAER